MTNLNKLLNTILIIIIIILSYKYMQLKNQVANDTARQNTEELNKDKNRIDSWIIYNNEQHQFSFKHPNLNDSCCTMGGPAASEEVIFSLTLADLDTVTVEYSNEPFAGIGVYVINTTTSFDDYIGGEKAALLDQDREFSESEFSDQEFIDDGVEEKITLAGQTGISLTNYSWDNIKRYYVPLPNSANVLVISQSGAPSSQFTFEEILSTFRFVQ